MVWYDFVILAILAYGAWQGAARGLVMQLAWIIAIVLCFKFAEGLAPQIESHISAEQPLRHWIAMFILYLGFSLGTFLVARSLNQALEKASFSDYDRHLGGLFGLLKGAVLSLVLTFFAVTLSETLKETVLRSKTGYVACQILDAIKPLTPEDAHPLIRDSLAQYEEALSPIHDEHPGQPTSLDEFFEGFSSAAGQHAEPQRGLHEDDFWAAPRNSHGMTYDDFLAALDRSARQRVQDSLKSVWHRLSAEDQLEITDELRFSSPTEVESTLRKLYSLTGGQGGATPPIQSGLIGEIADAYDDPHGTAISIQQHLTGVPVEVQEAVLADWYADLTMQDNDPDPRTDITSRLDDRILNQLNRQRYSIEDLAWDVRNRLQRSR